MIIHLTFSILWLGVMTAWFLIIRARFRALKPPSVAPEQLDEHPSVAIIIPARDEAINIQGCLRGLLSQDYPSDRLRLIVVNDNSRDATAAIVQRMMQDHAQLKLIDAPPLPDDWMGKQHACWHGAQQAEEDWLCFIDADTRAAPDLLKTVIADAEANQIDLLSLHPEQQMQSFWERLLMPVPFMSLMLILDADQINDPDSQAAMANGQFILVRHEVYSAVDGHRRIKRAVLEDVELGKLVKRSGWTIAIRNGIGLIHTRMYRDLETLWNALGRNGSELFGPLLTAIAAINSLFVAVFPIGYPLWLAFNVGGYYSALRIAALSCAALGTTMWYTTHVFSYRRLNVPLRYLLLLPVSNLLLGLVNLHGLFQRSAGLRTWKGRRL